MQERGLVDKKVHQVVLLSGPVASGKSTLTRLLSDRHGFCPVSTRELLAQRTQDRRSLQALGASLDQSSAGKWVLDELIRVTGISSQGVSIVVDAVRTCDQIRWVRDAFGASVVHVHIKGSVETLSARHNSRLEQYRYDEVRIHPVEQKVSGLVLCADLVIDTTYCSPESALNRLVSYLRSRD